MKPIIFTIMLAASSLLALPAAAQQPGILEIDGEDIATYETLEKCGFIYQVPDKTGGHKDEPERHIHSSYDDELGQYVLEMTLHARGDIDVCLPDRTDRQRNEIAIAGKDPSPSVAGEGQTLKVSWKFYLPEDIRATDKFCHVYQIKALCSVDRPSDIGMPIITFTLWEKDGKREFRVCYKGPHSNLTDKLFADDLGKFTGKWLKAESLMTMGRDGSLDVRISTVDGNETLCDLKGVKRDFWRDGATGIRPKWGLYRSVGDDGAYRSILKDETVKFADIRCENISYTK